jgi:hypothetical protein
MRPKPLRSSGPIQSQQSSVILTRAQNRSAKGRRRWCPTRYRVGCPRTAPRFVSVLAAMVVGRPQPHPHSMVVSIPVAGCVCPLVRGRGHGSRSQFRSDARDSSRNVRSERTMRPTARMLQFAGQPMSTPLGGTSQRADERAGLAWGQRSGSGRSSGSTCHSRASEFSVHAEPPGCPDSGQ